MRLKTLHKRKKRRINHLVEILQSFRRFGKQLVSDFENFDSLPIETKKAYFEGISKAVSGIINPENLDTPIVYGSNTDFVGTWNVGKIVPADSIKLMTPGGKEIKITSADIPTFYPEEND